MTKKSKVRVEEPIFTILNIKNKFYYLKQPRMTNIKIAIIFSTHFFVLLLFGLVKN